MVLCCIFALPWLLYRFGASTPIAQFLDSGAFTLYTICAVIMVAAARNARTNWNNAAFGALSAAFPNSGFMGVPLLVAPLDNRAAEPAIVTILVDTLIMTSLCIALSRLDGRGSGVHRRLPGRRCAGWLETRCRGRSCWAD